MEQASAKSASLHAPRALIDLRTVKHVMRVPSSSTKSVATQSAPEAQYLLLKKLSVMCAHMVVIFATLPIEMFAISAHDHVIHTKAYV